MSPHAPHKTSRTRHRWVAIASLGLVGSALAVPSLAQTSPRALAVLAVGEATFWPGGYVADATTTGLPASQACALARCSAFTVDLAKGGERLRVALDTAFRGDEFEVDLLDPAGVQQASAVNSTGTEFDIEAFTTKPAAGRWTVRVIPRQVSRASFRIRAKLEAAAPAKGAKRALLPDLMVTPPYEFSFTAPANPLNGLYPPDTVNPPLDVLGQQPLSCGADETADTGATRCLRFTTGPRNAGPGPFEIDYDPAAAGLGLTAPGPAYQRIYNTDGSSTLRRAGSFQFHLEHGHYHYLDILQFTAYTVGPHHELTLAGTGKKLGFCPADELFADWHTFNQDSTKTFTANCGYSGGAASLGLNTGWGDVYRWQRPGQFVDLGSHGDGTYLVRITVNPKINVLETTTTNDNGYALVRIVGDSVAILERGQGLSPWDPHKSVFTDQN